MSKNKSELMKSNRDRHRDNGLVEVRGLRIPPDKKEELADIVNYVLGGYYRPKVKKESE